MLELKEHSTTSFAQPLKDTQVIALVLEGTLTGVVVQEFKCR
jgi:hypothetical protein